MFWGLLCFEDGLPSFDKTLRIIFLVMRTEHQLFLVLRITPKSRAKVCAQWRILKPPDSLLVTDLSKAVVLV